MKRLFITLALGFALAIGGAVTSAEAQTPKPDRRTKGLCIYKVRQDSRLYEDTAWNFQKKGKTFFDRIEKGWYVAGLCYSRNGWKEIKVVNFNGAWGPVYYFRGDRDYMRTSTLDYVGRH